MTAPAKRMLTTDQIIDMISWALNIPVSRINPNTDLIDDLYLDQIDRDLLIAKLESRLGVFLSPDEVAHIRTVRDASLCFSGKAA